MIQIEPLHKKDILAYYALVRRVVSETPYYSEWAREKESTGYTPEWMEKSIESEEKILIAAKDKRRVVGFAFGYVQAGMLHLLWVGVDAEYRKQGIARDMVRAVEEWARGRVHKIWLDTRTNNDPSAELFAALGYRKAATFKKHYYAQDFYIWEKFLEEETKNT